MTDYQLWLGDCLEEMSRIEAGSIDMICADLPYGTTACKWDVVIPFEPLWAQYKRILKKRGACVLFGSQPFTSLLVVSNLEWFKYELIWDKVVTTNFQLANYQPLKNHESILVFGDSPCVFTKQGKPLAYYPQMTQTPQENIRPKKNGNLSQNMTRIRNGKHIHQTPEGISFPKSIITINRYNAECNPPRKLHPTQKPVALLEYLIKTYTNEGDLILDNCAGSGSTLEAAMRTDRRSIGIEKDAHYYQVVRQRLERVAAELRGEYVPKPAKRPIEDLPMFGELAR